MKYLIHELCFRIVRVLQLSTTMIMFQDLDKGYYSMNMTMFLDCEDCGGEYEGDCPIHGPLVIMKDTKVRCWTGLFGLTLTRLNTRATVRGSEMTMKCQFQWWRKLEYPAKTTDPWQVTGETFTHLPHACPVAYQYQSCSRDLQVRDRDRDLSIRDRVRDLPCRDRDL